MLESHSDREELEVLANKYHGDAIKIELHYENNLKKTNQNPNYHDWFEGRKDY
jgi:hypothetical protein